MKTIRIGEPVNLAIELVWGVRDKDGDVAVNEDMTGCMVRPSIDFLTKECPENAPYRAEAFVSGRTILEAEKQGIKASSLLILVDLLHMPDADADLVLEAWRLGIVHAAAEKAS